MEVATKEIISELESLINHHKDPKEGDLLVSQAGVMKTCAPYIGRLCAEYLNGDWCWQPYSRDTEYLSSMEEAEALLAEWRKEDRQ